MPRGEAGAAYLPEFTPPQEKPKGRKFLSMEERTQGLREEDKAAQKATASISPLENATPRLNERAKKERVIRIESRDPEPIDPQEDLFDDDDPTEEHDKVTWSEARLRAYQEEQKRIQEQDLAQQEEESKKALEAERKRGVIRRNGKILTDEMVRQEGQEGLKEIHQLQDQSPEPKAIKRAKKEVGDAQNEADLAAVREIIKMTRENVLIDAAQKRLEKAAWVEEQKIAERKEDKKPQQRAKNPGLSDVATLDFSKLPDNKTKWQPREGFVPPEIPPEEPKVVKKAKPEKFDVPLPLEPQKGMHTKKAKGFEERVVPTEIVKTEKPVEKKGFLSSFANSKLGKWAKRTALALGIMAASPASNRGPEQTQAPATAASVKEVPPELQRLNAPTEFNFQEPEMVVVQKPAETSQKFIQIEESDLQPEDYIIKGKVSRGSKAEKAPRGSNTSSSEVHIPNPYDGSVPEKKDSYTLRDPYEEIEAQQEETQTIPEVTTKRTYGQTSYERETKAPKEFKAEIKSPRLQSERMNPFNPRGPEVKKVGRNEYYDGASGSLFKVQGNKLTEIRFDWRGMPRKILIGEQGENGKYTPTDVIPVFEGKAMVNGKPAADSIQEWVQQATELRNKSM